MRVHTIALAYIWCERERVLSAIE